MTQNPYDAPGFHDAAIRAGRHRDVVGGRWEETGRIQMEILLAAGMRPSDRLLDIGAGALRLGCKAVPFLEPGHYWATDASRALMLAGRTAELPDPSRLPEERLIEDADFACPGVPDTIDYAIAFAVFPHLPLAYLRRALVNLSRLTRLRCLMFTVFLVPDAARAVTPYRQADGVVTHDLRPPYHLLEADVHHMARVTGWAVERSDRMLPRGQVLFTARRGSPSA
ncbi:class I SAM-dependent methyltransferase [Halovulum dunhuangense]|uniref:Class I SAM-dependent methyltransferase n=1 Tax=Halovulum dunhuangense TaxID=1505036 RepID=A0A849L5X5_9RHOB|nr:class I SAM-dependent methyltransferase [Halovulum dunhuangense]NNU81805.1 class I SAM-dependent methyltransferase [Halovulum dunhuangense]